ncbi:MAG: alpha/beta fold hydrolase [Rhodospirillales bacterium]|nr:alpha/beta fold hydrolase [Rhodospirillales bacterium]
MTAWPITEGVFELGDLPVARGGTIAGARIVWRAHGTLSPARDNVVLYPCSYGAQHQDLEWAIGPESLLDPGRWFIVIPNMFSNGLSSGAADTADYPAVVTYHDLVAAQARLLREVWGIERLAAVYGFSMGGQQAYHWATRPGVERAIVVCGSARTSVHNRVFLSSLLRTLEAAPEHLGQGRFSAEPRPNLKAFGHIYAAWALSQDFYRAGLHLTALGAPDLETFLRTDWEERNYQRRAANLYAQLKTWEAGDIAAGGDLAAALRAIEARVLLLPSTTDLYFRVADNEAEAEHLRHARLAPIQSIWGHRAGAPSVIPEDFAFLRGEVRAWLDR